MEEKKSAKLLPEHVLMWLVASRLRLLDVIKEGQLVNHFAAHLPVVAPAFRQAIPSGVVSLVPNVFEYRG